MRFFLDTNVLASGRQFEGNERTLLKELARRDPAPVTSEEVLAELEATLRQKFRYADDEARRATDSVRTWCFVQARSLPGPSAETPDQRILRAAIEAHVNYFVTGDRALLHLKVVSGVAIVRPADALRIIGTPG